MIKDFGLVGKSLKHSFSKSYFDEKFKELELTNNRYHLFEIDHIGEVQDLVTKYPNLRGLNITIPYKEEILILLNRVDKITEKIGAVNVVRIESDKTLSGFNTDYFGFKNSLENWIGNNKPNALVLGTGGASKAVCTALDDMKISFTQISRTKKNNVLTYEELKNQARIIRTHHLIINTTPLGMYPNINSIPQLDYTLTGQDHFYYDLVYNPGQTTFLKKGKAVGASIKNGAEMLKLQAEKSWEIWST